jgi:hypothetical protein
MDTEQHQSRVRRRCELARIYTAREPTKRRPPGKMTHDSLLKEAGLTFLILGMVLLLLVGL